MVLEIWAQDGYAKTNDILLSKNLKYADPFLQNINPSGQSLDLFQNTENKSNPTGEFMANKEENYSNSPNASSDNFSNRVENLDMEIEEEPQHLIDPVFRKRTASKDPIATEQIKKFKYPDEAMYDEFCQKSFDPNASSLNMITETEENVVETNFGIRQNLDYRFPTLPQNKCCETTNDHSALPKQHFNEKVYDYIDTNKCMSSHMI